MRVCFVAATEEELLLMWSVYEELREGGAETLFVRAGGGSRLDEMANTIGARFDISVQTGDAPSCAAAILERLPKTLEEFKPHWVVVHGADGYGVAGAMAAYYASFPVAHIGSGLRFGRSLEKTGKEACRRACETLSTVLFAPTQRACSNLLSENRPARAVHTTGSTLTNSLIRLKHTNSIGGSTNRIRQRLFGGGDTPSVILLIEHRDTLRDVLDGLVSAEKLLRGVRIVVVSQDKEFDDRGMEVTVCDGSRVIDVLLAAGRGVVVTDVGWVVEAAAVFGLGVVLVAEATDRPEAVEAGWAVLSGLEGRRVARAVVMMLRRWVAPRTQPFDGDNAAAHVAAILAQNRH